MDCERVNEHSHEALATRIRRHVLRMIHKGKSSHVGTSFSMAELLAVLYGGVLRVDPGPPRLA